MKHSEDVIKRIRAMRGQKPASEVGKEFGLSRDAVLGIWGRETRNQARIDGISLARHMAAPALSIVPVLSALTGAAAAIAADSGKGCRWPSGHPSDAGFFYCNEPVMKPGKPYCACHHAAAWGGRTLGSGWQRPKLMGARA